MCSCVCARARVCVWLHANLCFLPCRPCVVSQLLLLHACSSFRPRPHPHRPCTSLGWVSFQAAIARRCNDDRPAVRKSAVQGLVAVSLCHLQRMEGSSGHLPEAPVLTRGALVTLLHAAGDASTLVRKTAVQLTSDLLTAYPCNEDLQRLWLDTALPIVGDKETTLEAKGVEFVSKHLVQGVAAWTGTPKADRVSTSTSEDPANSKTNGALRCSAAVFAQGLGLGWVRGGRCVCEGYDVG